jgi:hypothetical protein
VDATVGRSAPQHHRAAAALAVGCAAASAAATASAAVAAANLAAAEATADLSAAAAAGDATTAADVVAAAVAAVVATAVAVLWLLLWLLLLRRLIWSLVVVLLLFRDCGCFLLWLVVAAAALRALALPWQRCCFSGGNCATCSCLACWVATATACSVTAAVAVTLAALAALAAFAAAAAVSAAVAATFRDIEWNECDAILRFCIPWQVNDGITTWFQFMQAYKIEIFTKIEVTADARNFLLGKGTFCLLRAPSRDASLVREVVAGEADFPYELIWYDCCSLTVCFITSLICNLHYQDHLNNFPGLLYHHSGGRWVISSHQDANDWIKSV